MNKNKLKALIAEAFASNTYPGDWCLKRGMEGSEPYDVERDFKGKKDWRTIEAKLLDTSPNGLSSALSFLSDEAFRFFLPAFLIADIEDKLERVDVCFSLFHGFDNSSRSEKINPRRYGERTWFDSAKHKYAMFTCNEVEAIVSYLDFKKSDTQEIEEALINYWRPRLQELKR